MKQIEPRIWAFDFDGTLSNIVSNRHAAVMDPECEDLLRKLAAHPDQVVAVVSSRSLDDLKSRVKLDNIVLAGGSGLEWAVPGGHWLGPNREASARLAKERKRLLPSLKAILRFPGVELEDKKWSAAVHFRNAATEDRIEIARELETLRVRHGAVLHYGPEVSEIQFLREVSKEIAVRTLVKLFGPQQSSRNMLFAGDDQNDAQAMRWISERRGIIYIVGNRVSVPGARTVESPKALARDIKRRFDWIEERAESNGQEVTND